MSRRTLPECRGYGYKKGSGEGGAFARRNWKKRYFVLDQFAFYYYKQQMGKMKGQFARNIILSASDAGRAADRAKKGYMLKLELSDRPFYMVVDTPQERDQWLEALNAGHHPRASGKGVRRSVSESNLDEIQRKGSAQEEQWAAQPSQGIQPPVNSMPALSPPYAAESKRAHVQAKTMPRVYGNGAGNAIDEAGAAAPPRPTGPKPPRVQPKTIATTRVATPFVQVQSQQGLQGQALPSSPPVTAVGSKPTPPPKPAKLQFNAASNLNRPAPPAAASRAYSHQNFPHAASCAQPRTAQPTAPSQDINRVEESSRFVPQHRRAKSAEPQFEASAQPDVLPLQPSTPTPSPSSKPQPKEPLKPPGPSAAPPACRAQVLYTYTAEDPKELTLAAGEMIDVLRKTDSGWWKARTSAGQVGWAPSNYLSEL